MLVGCSVPVSASVVTEVHLRNLVGVGFLLAEAADRIMTSHARQSLYRAALS